MMLLKRAGSGQLDHIKFISENSHKKDHILKAVISTFQSMNWKDAYGLSITETMKLEFSDYLYMVDELRRHTKIVSESTAEAEKEVIDKNK